MHSGHHQTAALLSHAAGLPFHTDILSPLLLLSYYLQWQIRGGMKLSPHFAFVTYAQTERRGGVSAQESRVGSHR